MKKEWLIESKAFSIATVINNPSIFRDIFNFHDGEKLYVNKKKINSSLSYSFICPIALHKVSDFQNYANFTEETVVQRCSAKKYS